MNQWKHGIGKLCTHGYVSVVPETASITEGTKMVAEKVDTKNYEG